MNTAAKIILILLAATAACNRNDDSAVPRRTAYPRLELYADSTVTAGIGGVSFDINAREYNGRWYNDIRAWRVERGAAPAPADTPVINAPKVEVPDFSKAANDPDDLHF